LEIDLRNFFFNLKLEFLIAQRTFSLTIRKQISCTCLFGIRTKERFINKRETYQLEREMLIN